MPPQTVSAQQDPCCPTRLLSEAVNQSGNLFRIKFHFNLSVQHSFKHVISCMTSIFNHPDVSCHPTVCQFSFYLHFININHEAWSTKEKLLLTSHLNISLDYYLANICRRLDDNFHKLDIFAERQVRSAPEAEIRKLIAVAGNDVSWNAQETIQFPYNRL